MHHEINADQEARLAKGGRGRLYIGGRQVGENRPGHIVPNRFTTHARMDNGEPVLLSYRNKSAFAFTGKIGNGWITTLQRYD